MKTFKEFIAESDYKKHYTVNYSYDGNDGRNSGNLKIRNVKDGDHAKRVAEYKNSRVKGFKVHSAREFTE